MPHDDAVFRFCPYDGRALEPHAGQDEHAGRPRCPACGFIDYQNPKPCVAVVVEQEGRILLGKRAVEPMKGLWDILGGFMEAGESAEEAARREIREESGLDVTIVRYLGSIPDTYGPRNIPTLNFAFLAIPSGGALRPASDVGELRWFPIAELPTEWPFAHQPKVIETWRSRRADS